MKKQRKQYAPEEKVAILRRHLLDKEPTFRVAVEVDNFRLPDGPPSSGR